MTPSEVPIPAARESWRALDTLLRISYAVMRCRRPPDERETMPTLYIEHMNNQETEIVLHPDTGPFRWEPTPEGLLVTLDRNGSRTVFPWPTVKSYTIMIEPNIKN